ncbi:autotransporter outer membrane beta-barrel domain-containing protein [Luteolibacter sp. Populi]|uniref:autotransporter outer membrane beta-barrel domain-containing protein n=1 Tax=Luteolibacter sp. Populi TaxID=3230487 RepID=UPI003466496E
MNTPSAYCLRFLAVAVAGAGFARAGDETPPDNCFPDNRGVTSASISNGVIGSAWAASHDVGGRLAAHRAGIRPASRLVEEATFVPAGDAKGGMGSAKGAKVAAIAVPKPNKWEIYGSLYYYSEDQDGDSYGRRSKKKKDEKYDKAGGALVSRFAGGGSADTSLEVFGGSVGLEHHLNSEWSIGAAIGASSADVDMGSAGSADIDTVAVSPYISYYRPDTFGYADLWADLLYSYGMHSIDTRRNTGGGIATGSPDADTHTLELTVGVNFGEEDVVHGPYAGMRYITGTIDAYTEVGPGATYFGEQDLDSLVSILGYQISWKLRGSSGYWVPQLRAAWEHEFEDGNVSGFGIPVNSRDEDIGVIGANLGYYFDNGWNLGVEYEGRFGSETQGHYGGVRAGKEF